MACGDVPRAGVRPEPQTQEREPNRLAGPVATSTHHGGSMDDQIAPSAPITLAAALLSDSLESCLKHLDSAQQFKASMALDPDFISPETRERVGAAIQELYDLAEGSAAILIDELLDGPSS